MRVTSHWRCSTCMFISLSKSKDFDGIVPSFSDYDFINISAHGDIQELWLQLNSVSMIVVLKETSRNLILVLANIEIWEQTVPVNIRSQTSRHSLRPQTICLATIMDTVFACLLIGRVRNLPSTTQFWTGIPRFA